MESRGGLLAIVGTIALLIGATVVQGLWTERWSKREDRLLQVAGKRLEQAFPDAFGQWKLERTIETSAAELERAGAIGSVSRVYRNQKTKTAVSAFVVCATPHDASGHTPDRCYPGAGFQIAEPEHRESISLGDGRRVEAYTGTFAKEGQTLRIFWTYGVPSKAAVKEGEEPTEPESAETKAVSDAGSAAGPRLDWVAPQVARIALNEFPSVYKFYAIVDQTKLPSSRATAECQDFISELVPVFEAALAAEAAREPGSPAPAEPTPVEPTPSEPAPAERVSG